VADDGRCTGNPYREACWLARVAVPGSGGPKGPCHSCVPRVSVVLRAWSPDIVVQVVGGKFMSAFVRAVGS
jgi:hypothetical protein